MYNDQYPRIGSVPVVVVSNVYNMLQYDEGMPPEG